MIYAAVLAVAFVLIWLTRKRASPDPLDKVLHTWPSGDPFTVRHLCTNVVVIGAIGSGKSSGSGLFLARMALKLPNSGGCVLASKPGDVQWWQDRFREAKRSEDLIVFSKDSPARTNFIQHELESGGDARSLVSFLTVSGEVIEGSGGRGSNDQFWRRSEERLLLHAINALMQAGERVDAPNIQKFIISAAFKPADRTDETWLNGYHPFVLNTAYKRPKTEMEAADQEQFRDYWINEWPLMDDKPRSSIMAGVNNLLFVYNSGLVRQIISTTTNAPIGDLLTKGRWWLWDFNVHEHSATGRFMMSCAKYKVQKAILRRHASPSDPLVFIYADECQNVANSFDHQFLAENRSHNSCMIYLTQSIHSFMTTME